MALERPVLLVPGYGNSGPDHWQSLWERARPGARRVALGDWERPTREGWLRRLDEAVAGCARPPVLVAHSLGATAVVAWAARQARPVHAALLVAPPDLACPALPAEVRAFGAAPALALPFRALLAASRTDPYCSLEQARALAQAWGARLVDLGDAGHVNAASGHGVWPEGERLLAELSNEASPSGRS